MKKLKQFFKTPMGLLLGIFLGLLFIFIMLIKLTSGSNSEQVAKKMLAQKDKPLQSNIRYTTQETLNTLTGETDNLTQNMNKLERKFAKIKTDNEKNQNSTKQMIQQEIKALETENQSLKGKVNRTISALKKASVKPKHSILDKFQIGGDNSIQIKNAKKIKSDFIWIQDNNNSEFTQEQAEKNTEAEKSNSVFDIKPAYSNIKKTVSLLRPDQNTNEQTEFNRKPKIKPYYTIPPNTWSTGVIVEQPLIGVIPNNNEVLNPQSVMFALSKKNLSANNWRLPAVIRGMQGNAICQGVFVTFSQSYVQCDVQSLTFIFNDGTISTINGTKEQPLGQLTNRYGNPYIRGKYYGNAAFAAAGTGFFSGLQGFGNAFAAGQQQISQGAGGNMYAIKNTLKYGAGNAVGAMGEAWNDWWHDLLKSTTNFVYVPNWNSQTHKLLQFNIKISKAIPIDYDSNGRKVNYENQINMYANNSLD